MASSASRSAPTPPACGRIPAGLNNIVNLKPSVDALSITGVIPACRTLDCVSIFALTAADAYSREIPKPGYAALPPILTIGVPEPQDLRFSGDIAMEEAYVDALSLLQFLCHRLVDIPFGEFYKTADLLYDGAWVAEREAAVKTFFDSSEDISTPSPARSTVAPDRSRRPTLSKAFMPCRL